MTNTHYRWNDEYSKKKDLPSSRTDHPSSSLVRFLEGHNELAPGKMLDLGSGSGRNSIHMAKLGWEAVGIEFSDLAVDIAVENTQKQGLRDLITYLNQSVAEPIPYPDRSFDLAIDMMTMHLLDQNQRQEMIKEVIRLLKTGGYFLFHTLAAEGTEALKLINESPGDEVNSYTFKAGMHTVTEKCFTQAEIVEMLHPLEQVELESIESVTKAFGGEFTRVYLHGLFKKV